MAEKARGYLLIGMFLLVTPGPALTADSSATVNTAVSAETTNPRPPDAIMYDAFAPDATLYAPVEYLRPEKRSQLGFHGMRGKKDFESDWYKRASMGFQGMRGKKWQDELLDKRAMGFQGMRGKKWLNDEEMLKRASMGFQGMRGKKWQEELDKRASMGFQGMRGKKLLPSEYYDLVPLLDDYDELEKRAMGFQGMRGKKDDEKRAMGFQGMRGKKDNEVTQEDDMGLDKRASSGFHGMRGKKQNDFSLKRAMGFLGMRGKKSQLDTTDDETTSAGKEDIGSLIAYLNESPSPARSRRAAPIRSSKKARNAFFGMRGKKTVDEGDKL